MGRKCARKLASGSLIKRCLHAWLLNRNVSTLADAWVSGISKTYLEPVGICSGTYFSWNNSTITDIQSRNPHLSNSKFLLPSSTNRPFLIIGSTLIGPMDASPISSSNYNVNYTRLEFTPLYIGQMKTRDITFNIKSKEYNANNNMFLRGSIMQRQRIGGVVESFAVGRVGVTAPLHPIPPNSTSALLIVPHVTHPIDLAYVAGSSSFAPGQLISSLPRAFARKLGMTLDYWSPSSSSLSSSSMPSSSNAPRTQISSDRPTVTRTAIADGGSCENTNLLSFLQRRVEKIVLVINSHTPLMSMERWNVTLDPPTEGQVSRELQ